MEEWMGHSLFLCHWTLTESYQSYFNTANVGIVKYRKYEFYKANA